MQAAAKTTSTLLREIQSANTVQEAVEYHRLNGDLTLSQYLTELMDAYDFSPRDIISRCWLDRSYVYHLLSGIRNPGRNIVLRIGFGMGVRRDEMDRLLRLADHSPLYSKRRRDALLIYALTKHYDLDRANDLLIEEGEEPLFLVQSDAE